MAEPAFRFGLILLAAGSSSRMGQPKQLLIWQGQSLLRRSVETALATKAWPIVVVLGSQASLLSPELARLPVQIVENPHWSEGMASSIRAGLTHLDNFSGALDGVVIALCDQPHFAPGHVHALCDAHLQTQLPLAACAYNETLGPPALFTRSLFPELHQLAGQEGARRVLLKYRDTVAMVESPELAVDLDTPADYHALVGKGSLPTKHANDPKT